MLSNTQEDRNFVTILADGKLHMTVEEGTEGARKREYETSDGKTGEKWELVFTEVTGKITEVKFFEGDYGKSLQLKIEDGDEKPVVLSLSCASNYGEDAMKKIINVDLEKDVKIVPYSFLDDKGKNKKGVTIYQEDQKIKNFFYDEDAKKNINGYPEPKKLKKPLSKDQWKLYFMEARMFLIDAITEHFKLEKVNEDADLDELAGDMTEEKKKF